MKRLKKLIVFALSASMLLGAVAFADEDTTWKCTVEPDFSNNILVVSGNAAADTTLTVMVLPQGKKPEDIWGLSVKSDKTAVGELSNTTQINLPTVSANPDGIVKFISQYKIDDNGAFVINMGVPESGTYDVWILSNNTNEVYKYADVKFVNSDDYNDAVGKLNDKISDKNGFIGLFEDAELLLKLGFDNLAAKDAAEILFAHQNGTKLLYDYENNKALYSCCQGIAMLNSGKSADMECLLYAMKDDSVFTDWYNKYIKSETAEKYILDKISNKNIKNPSGLANELSEALILYVVENPNGYENIKDIFEDFKNITGINSPTQSLSVYSSLSGEAFASFDALITQYNQLTKNKVNGGGSSGGGGGSSYSGSKLEIGAAQTETAEPMNKDIFDDFDDALWAKDAIVELAAKNVIAGKEDNKFCPNDLITREEFTKLVTAAFINDVEEAEISFEDVPKNRWSYSYVAKAKNAGLINGYSDVEFGAEDLILRQDMAVIIYNTAVYKNAELTDASKTLTFSDDGDIADYAKDCVYALKASGIINGVSDTEFAPSKNATRAEAAMIIYKLLQK